MPEFDKYIKKAKSMGITEAKIIDPKSVVVGDWVRLKCQYGCGGYGKNLTCPPYSRHLIIRGKCLENILKVF